MVCNKRVPEVVGSRLRFNEKFGHRWGQVLLGIEVEGITSGHEVRTVASTVDRRRHQRWAYGRGDLYRSHPYEEARFRVHSQRVRCADRKREESHRGQLARR